MSYDNAYVCPDHPEEPGLEPGLNNHRQAQRRDPCPCYRSNRCSILTCLQKLEDMEHGELGRELSDRLDDNKDPLLDEGRGMREEDGFPEPVSLLQAAKALLKVVGPCQVVHARQILQIQTLIDRRILEQRGGPGEGVPTDGRDRVLSVHKMIISENIRSTRERQVEEKG